MKQNLAVEFEALANVTNQKIPQEGKKSIENFWLSTQRSSWTMYMELKTKDCTYDKLKDLINNPNIVILEGDKLLG